MAAVRSNNLGRPRPRLKDFVSIDSDLETSIKCLSVLPKNINASRSSVHYSSSGALVRRIKSSSCFRLRLSPVVERASLARPTLSGVHDRALATADKLCSSSCSNPWNGGSGFDFADRCSNRFLSREYGFCPEGPARNASRSDAGGDYRTQPGVLTPGTDKKGTRPEGGGREAFSALDAERDPQRIPSAPSAPPTRYAGAIRTWRSTSTLR
jgi:hypothetical protein